MIKNLMASRVGVQLAKRSPEILMVVGVVGVVSGTVMACKATLKAQAILDEADRNIKTIKEVNETANIDVYSEKDYRKDLAVAYIQTGTKFAKLYAPSLIVGVASIGCLLGSHRIIQRRNVALMAAYKVVKDGFNSYRQRVQDEYGEEKDYMFKHGLTHEEVVETEVGENGKSKKVKKTKLTHENDMNDVSVYARFFDESCAQWTKTPEYNFMFLRAQQNYYNDMLKSRGHVFLNEVYDALGIPRTQAGSVVGWVVGEGDSFIDFGIFDGERQRAREFVNGYERSILLDFNVDGVIYDMI